MIKPRGHTRVNRLTVTELEHVFTFREHVLGIASQYAARNRTDAACKAASPGLDLPGFQKVRISFWRRLIGEIEAQDETAAFEAGASLVRNNWKFMKKVFVELFPAA